MHKARRNPQKSTKKSTSVNCWLDFLGDLGVNISIKRWISFAYLPNTHTCFNMGKPCHPSRECNQASEIGSSGLTNQVKRVLRGGNLGPNWALRTTLLWRAEQDPQSPKNAIITSTPLNNPGWPKNTGGLYCFQNLGIQNIFPKQFFYFFILFSFSCRYLPIIFLLTWRPFKTHYKCPFWVYDAKRYGVVGIDCCHPRSVPLAEPNLISKKKWFCPEFKMQPNRVFYLRRGRLSGTLLRRRYSLPWLFRSASIRVASCFASLALRIVSLACLW